LNFSGTVEPFLTVFQTIVLVEDISTGVEASEPPGADDQRAASTALVVLIVDCRAHAVVAHF
jgi:hypothetical protein